jgi:hypothetical protein
LDAAAGTLPSFGGLNVHVLPALALLPTFFIDPEFGVVIEAVLSLDGGEADAPALLDAPVLGDQLTSVFSGEDVAAIGQDVSAGLFFGLFAGFHGGAFLLDLGRQGDKVHPALIRLGNDYCIDEGVQRH